MTDDGQSGGSRGNGPEGRDVPPRLRSLDADLRSVRFRPRDDLEDEVLGRVARARRERRTAPLGGWLRDAGAAAAVLAMVGLLGLLERAGAGRATVGSAGETSATAAPHISGGWAMQWGPDARVLALGPPAERRSAGDRELRCGRVESRIRCRGVAPEAIPSPADPGGSGAVLRDFCCLDYDGGGPADDGVRVVAGRDETVLDFWIYEDRDETRSFTEGDLVRTVVPGVPPAGAVPGAAGGVRRLDRCCADLDGGPRSDDGVFVVAGGRERVALAVLYEDENDDGRLSPGDRLRAVRAEDGSNVGSAAASGERREDG